MPDDEQGGDGGDSGGGGQGGNQSDDPGEFNLGYEIKELKQGGHERRGAAERQAQDQGDSGDLPDPDDPGAFELTDVVEGKRDRENENP